MPARSLLVAGLQTAGVPDEPEATLELLKQRVHAAGDLSDGLQLVLAPELYLMALPSMLDERAGAMEERAVEVPGPLTAGSALSRGRRACDSCRRLESVR